MARKPVRAAPYYAAFSLAGWAAANWNEFDGWCAAHGVDPLALTFDRLLNLVYWRMIQYADKEKRAAIDLLLASAPDAERDPDAPSWWVSDEHAYHSSMQATGQIRGA